jgi:hypothetical protein
MRLAIGRGLDLLFCLGYGGSTQSLLDGVLNFSPPFQAEHLVDYLAVTSDIKRRWKELNSAVRVPNRILADHDGIIYSHLFGKL